MAESDPDRPRKKRRRTSSLGEEKTGTKRRKRPASDLADTAGTKRRKRSTSDLSDTKRRRRSSEVADKTGTKRRKRPAAEGVSRTKRRKRTTVVEPGSDEILSLDQLEGVIEEREPGPRRPRTKAPREGSTKGDTYAKEPLPSDPWDRPPTPQGQHAQFWAGLSPVWKGGFGAAAGTVVLSALLIMAFYNKPISYAEGVSSTPTPIALDAVIDAYLRTPTSGTQQAVVNRGPEAMTRVIELYEKESDERLLVDLARLLTWVAQHYENRLLTKEKIGKLLRLPGKPAEAQLMLLEALEGPYGTRNDRDGLDPAIVLPILREAKDQQIRRMLLGKLRPGKKLAEESLGEILALCDDPDLRREAQYLVERLAPWANPKDLVAAFPKASPELQETIVRALTYDDGGRPRGTADDLLALYVSATNMQIQYQLLHNLRRAPKDAKTEARAIKLLEVSKHEHLVEEASRWCGDLLKVSESPEGLALALGKVVEDAQQTHRTRLAAGEALRRAGAAKARAAIPSLRKARDDPRIGVTIQHFLLELGDVDMDALLKDLESPDMKRVRVALQTLQRIGPKAEPAIAALVKLMGSRDSAVAADAVSTLGRIGKAAKGEVSKIVEYGKTGRSQRSIARYALARIVGRTEADRLLPRQRRR